AVAISSIEGSVIEIQDVLSVEPVLPSSWSARLRELSELQEGWLDGKGERVSRQVLRQTETLLLDCLEAGIGRPRIFPTENGGVRLEWVFDDSEVSADIESSYVISLLSFSKLNDDDDEEQVLAWSHSEDVVDFIRRGIGDHTTATA